MVTTHLSGAYLIRSRISLCSRMLCAVLALLLWTILLPNTSFAQSVKKLFPDVVSVKVKVSGTNSFDFDVTVSSPYDTAARYADGFRVVAPDGDVLGERKLWHDHQTEQPFTRDLYNVKIPSTIQTVTVQARDQISGYGGKRVIVKLPSR